MSRTLNRTSARYLTRHPWQLVLALGGVGLGVAVAVAVALATESAQRAFKLSNDRLVGTATHQVVAGTAGLPDELYRRLRVDLGIRKSAPIVEGFARSEDAASGTLRIIGIDPLAESFRGDLGMVLGTDAYPLDAFLTEPGAVLAPEALGSVGDVVEATVDGRLIRLAVVGRVPGDGSALADTVVADIATAQELLELSGRLSRIDLQLDATDLGDRVQAELPSGARLVEAAARADTTVQMTAAFELNLRAMSLLAVLCGMFLIYNTMAFSVVQRRELFGALRAVGVTRREILRLVLAEAVAVGTVGTLLGLAGGIALASRLVRLVTRTINDLYFAVAVEQVALEPRVLAGAAALGILATLVSAIAPARQAAGVAPRVAMMRSAEDDSGWVNHPGLAGAGVLAGLAGFALATWRGGDLVAAFGGLLMVVLGASLLAPTVVRAVAKGGAALLGAIVGTPGRMAARALTVGLGRVSVAVAALALAVAVVVGVGVMVTSFRTTLIDWLGYTLQADLYVSPVSARGQSATLRLSNEQLSEIANLTGVDRLATIRTISVETSPEPTAVLAPSHAVEDRESYRLLEPSGNQAMEDAWMRFEGGEVLVSEPLAERRGVAVGDVVTLPSPSGALELRVAGVYVSYASDRGEVMMRRSVYASLWRDPLISGLALHLADGATRDGVARQLREILQPLQVVVVSNSELRAQSLVIFDRTFRITAVLQTLVTLVAAFGVFGAVLAQQLERAREYALLRLTGFTPGQLRALIGAQAGLMSVASIALALPVGWVLAWLMIHVINKRSFGWTLQMTVPPGVLGQAAAVALVAALLAAIYPAVRATIAPPGAALREE